MNWTTWDWLRYLLNFGLVIVLLLGCLWTLKRMQNKTSLLQRKGTRRLHVLESLSLGPRQKIMLISVDGRELLVSATPGTIQTLSVNPTRVSELA
jgi:flagellar protein FliO/FliZ